MTDYVKLWAERCKDDLADLPEEISVNKCFCTIFDIDEIIDAFRLMKSIWYTILGDIALNPEIFNFPVISSDDHKYSDAKGLEARTIPWRPIQLLYNVCVCGEYYDGVIMVNGEMFREMNNVKNHNDLLKGLVNYGFYIEGLTNYKVVKSTNTFTISYPDNHVLLYLMSLIAKKASMLNRKIDFLLGSYRILEDDMNSAPYINLPVYITDRLHSDDEKKFCYRFHEIMRDKGYFTEYNNSSEGPYINYYDKESTMQKKGPYIYKVGIFRTPDKLRLLLRIRNIDKIIVQANSFSESVNEMLRFSDDGCICRERGDCTHSVHYIFEGKERWHCGCWQAPFAISPRVEDIPDYLKMIEIGTYK